MRTGLRKKADAPDESPVSIYREQIARPKGIVFVALEFAAYGDVPAEPVLEDRLSDAMHLIQIADVAFCVVFRYTSYHSMPLPVHWDEALPDGKRELELSTFQASLFLRRGAKE